MDEVKEEKFGFRNSILKDIFDENDIEYITNIWCVTCRWNINKNKNTRYLVIFEGNYNEEYKNILEYINPNITVINVKFKEEEQKIAVYNMRTAKTGELTYEKFKNRIIQLTDCKFINSYAKGSYHSTPLSRFFREYMGKGFALTDIDFYITKNKMFIEEKNFFKKGEFGYLGQGQCFSFKEVLNDIFFNSKILIICVSNNEFIIGNLNNIDCNEIECIDGWGKMVPFKMKKISLKELLEFLKK